MEKVKTEDRSKDGYNLLNNRVKLLTGNNRKKVNSCYIYVLMARAKPIAA